MTFTLNPCFTTRLHTTLLSNTDAAGGNILEIVLAFSFGHGPSRFHCTLLQYMARKKNVVVVWVSFSLHKVGAETRTD